MRAQQLSVDICGNELRVFSHRLKPVPLKEIDFEGQAEELTQPEIARPQLDRFEQQMPHPQPEPLFRYTKRAHLAEVLPHCVDRAVAYDPVIAVNRNHKLGHRTIELNQVFAEQNSSLNQGRHELDHGRDVAGARGAHPYL